MSSASIIGPLTRRVLVVDGYSVPCAEAWENDGGTVTFLMDGRMAWDVPAGAFEDVAHLIATAYALGLGLPCNPQAEGPGGGNGESFGRQMELVPAMLRPSQVHEVEFVQTEEVEPDDDPRASCRISSPAAPA